VTVGERDDSGIVARYQRIVTNMTS